MYATRRTSSFQNFADLSTVAFHTGRYEVCNVDGVKVELCTTTHRDGASTEREFYDEELCGDFVTSVCRVSVLHDLAITETLSGGGNKFVL